MIYEVRTYDLKTGHLSRVVAWFADRFEKHKNLSHLVGFWQTEIGPLNQIVQIWQYEGANDRARNLAAAKADDLWPPEIASSIIKQTSEVFRPWDISPLLEPGEHGPFYEFRTYLVRPDLIPQSIRRWDEALHIRTKHSPISVVMQGETGTINKLLHIWPYKTLDERQKIREDVIAEGLWPPKHPPGEGEEMALQENKILVPVPFSPMQ